MSPGRTDLFISTTQLFKPPQLFFIKLCNIRGLRPNFQSVDHRLSSSKPHLLFLTLYKILVRPCTSMEYSSHVLGVPLTEPH